MEVISEGLLRRFSLTENRGTKYQRFQSFFLLCRVREEGQSPTRPSVHSKREPGTRTSSARWFCLLGPEVVEGKLDVSGVLRGPEESVGP